MKLARYSILIVLIAFSSIHTQTQPITIPNESFENWTGGEPDGWTTNNVAPSVITTVTQSSDAKDGASALKLEVASYMDMSVGSILWVGSLDQPGFPVSAKKESLTGWYKFSPAQGDVMSIVVTMSENVYVIGEAVLDISTASSSYTFFEIDLEYIGSSIPDKCDIYILISSLDGESAPHLGSYGLVDDLALTPFQVGTSVNDLSVPDDYSLYQNYPNPFNPTTMIYYSIPKQSFVTLKIFDALGREITTLVSGVKSTGNYKVEFDAVNHPSGIYFY